jgi:hypothetical protein
MNVSVVKLIKDKKVKEITYTLNETAVRGAIFEYLKKHHGFLEKGCFEWRSYENKNGRMLLEVIQNVEVE